MGLISYLSRLILEFLLCTLCYAILFGPIEFFFFFFLLLNLVHLVLYYKKSILLLKLVLLFSIRCVSVMMVLLCYIYRIVYICFEMVRIHFVVKI